MGNLYNSLTADDPEKREFGGVICCNECTKEVHAGNPVRQGDPKNWGGVNLWNSKCKPGDKEVATWHTHPPGFPLQKPPGEDSPDYRQVDYRADLYECDYLSFMTTSDGVTTVLDSEGNETTF